MNASRQEAISAETMLREAEEGLKASKAAHADVLEQMQALNQKSATLSKKVSTTFI